MIVKDSCTCLYTDAFHGLTGCVSVYAGYYRATAFEKPTVYFLDVTERYNGFSARTYRVFLGRFKKAGSARNSRAIVAGCNMFSTLRHPFPATRTIIENNGYIAAAEYMTHGLFEGVMLND